MKAIDITREMQAVCELYGKQKDRLSQFTAKEAKGRIALYTDKGDKLASFPNGTTRDICIGLCNFVEAFWYWER
jgi:hypothetical protein